MDNVFKIIFLGKQGVGKSSILIRYTKGSFSQHYNITVGLEFTTKEVIISNNQAINLQIWDTAGQQLYKSIVRSFYKGIAGVFLVFSLESQQSLQQLKMWHKEVKENGSEHVIFFLIGTKADLEEQRQVSYQRIQQMVIQLGAEFYVETSSKTGMNIEKIFSRAGEIIHKRYLQSDSYRYSLNIKKILVIQNLQQDQEFQNVAGDQLLRTKNQ